MHKTVKVTQEIWKERCKKHKNCTSFDIYTNMHTIMEFECKIHGKFKRGARDFLNSPMGCAECGGIEGGNKNTIHWDEFVEKSSLKHSKQYSYIRFDGKRNAIILCPVHGEFCQNKIAHLCGRGCKKCGNIKTQNSKRKNIDWLIARAKEMGAICLSNEYTNCHSKYSFLCQKCSYKWEASASSIAYGVFDEKVDRRGRRHGCPNCAGKTTNIDTLKTYGIKNGGKLIDGQVYKGMKFKYQWICRENHVFGLRAYHAKDGHWCAECASIRNHRILRGNIDDLINVAMSRGGQCLSKEYISQATKYLWRCNRGHEWQSSGAGVISGTWCPECAGVGKKDLSYIKSLALERDGKCLSDIYSSMSSKYAWMCNKSHIWNATASNIQQGQWCPYCKKSKGEEIINSVLCQYGLILNSDHIRQYRFENCKYKRSLIFDFYFPKLNICLEFNGKQHDSAIDYFGGIQAFRKLQKCDQIKIDYCKNNNIRLIIIPYSQIKNIESILVKELNLQLQAT